MKKTTVYLSEEEAAALRAAARTTGKSQAELIREGVRRVTLGNRRKKRVFHSMGIADSGDPTLAERVDEILREEWGKADA
jgi:hypothetical protein